jgi:signal transduction histidine kinase
MFTVYVIKFHICNKPAQNESNEDICFMLVPLRSSLTFATLVFLLFIYPLFSGEYAVSAYAANEKNQIVVGGDYYYPPYEFLDKNGTPIGLNVELTQAIAELMGIDVEIKLGPWSEMRKALANGSVDALQGMVFSDERALLFDFSPPHSVIHQSVFARKNSPGIQSISDLDGKEVIVQKNGIMHDYLNSLGKSYVLIEKETHAQALRLLASGKHDYAVVANLPGLYLSQELGLSNLVRVAEPIMAGPYGYAVKKGNTELLALFSEGLSVLKNTGRYQEIKNKWLSPFEPARIPLKKLLKIGSMVFFPLLLIVVGVSIWNKLLQRKIALATDDLQKEIIERKRAARESEAKQQQLIQADKMVTLGVLVSGVAHEINNPTGLILLNIPILTKIFQVVQDLLDEQYAASGDFMIGGMKYSELKKQLPKMLDEMLESANRIKRIVADLKDFARVETAAISEQVDINKVVEASLRLLNSTINKFTDNLSVDCGTNVPLVLGNAQRLEQVLVNLIVNGCQALSDKNNGVTITTRYDETNQEVLVIVDDEGIGIDEKNMSHILDPFFTTKRSEGGTGLGLSVSAGIVKDHNGKLVFQSSSGRGTRATLSLPVI